MQRKTIILTFDDALRNHLEFVAPILKNTISGQRFMSVSFPTHKTLGNLPT